MNDIFHISFITMLFLWTLVFSSCYAAEPDLDMTVPDMIQFRNFNVETHHVTTQDCYVLSLHRIVNPITEIPAKERIPVLFMHGLYGSSAEWVMNSIGGDLYDQDNRSLAFQLARLGYDVWLGNNRGNEYSHHVEYSKDIWSKFWEYNMDDLALFDLPAMIGYVQKKSEFDRIAYVGFSQGTKQMFALLSLKPETADSLQSIVMLGPGSRIKHNQSLLRVFAQSWTLLQAASKFRSVPIFKDVIYKALVQNGLCTFNMVGSICGHVFLSIPGYSEQELNETRVPVYLQHFPNTISTRHMIHYLQHLNTGKFQQYDYGWAGNEFCYDQPDPKQIPLENVRTQNLYLIYALKDKMTPYEDLEWTLAQMTQAKWEKYQVEDQEWQHIDFQLAIHADERVNVKALEFLKKGLQKPMEGNAKIFPVYDASTCNRKSNKCHQNLFEFPEIPFLNLV